ncbi:MAG TPA: lipid-A-disaccharide synthase [Porticoccaceae bacterium]|nr:lipid-A-disaccharide synthase [Porticoccaceae bacterium]
MSTGVVFAIVAGEASGDLLGADLIKNLRESFPSARFEGVGGPLMQAQGFTSHHDMERLSVMGLVEPLKRLPELLRMRRALIDRYRRSPPTAFIGIDAPDFNLHIEGVLRRDGVKTIHYVSPSVWAWRQGRIKKIRRCVDLMLTLLPFENAFYHQHDVPVCFVGHPLAGEYALLPDTGGSRSILGLCPDAPVLTLMPGSRGSEVTFMGDLFLDVVERIKQAKPELQVLIPAANDARHAQITDVLCRRNIDGIRLLRQQSKLAMEASDVVLLASGTTALEAMLLKKPMVVSYRLGRFTYQLLSPFIKTPFIALPNLLAGRALVPELIQSDATVDRLSAAVIEAFDPIRARQLEKEFTAIHHELAMSSGQIAASAIHDLVQKC